MAANGMRTQYPYEGDPLSPRPPYDYSPTSNYSSAVSPSFFPMAYQISPRFGASAFIPPSDVFGQGRGDTVRENGAFTPRDSAKSGSGAPNTDPVAMHLLVETAIGDSQHFDILTVEEVDALKQEQKTLDARLATVRRKLESETKIRDATRSLTRLASKKENKHQRKNGSNASNASNAVQEYDEKPQGGLEASCRKVEEHIRELLEIESRMRMIDMQLLMHTAAVLQLTHKGPKRRNRDSTLSNDGIRRPDSPASLNTYEVGRGAGADGDAFFDERSFYRSPENLDSLMNALQNGTHHRSHSVDRQNQALSAMGKRLDELNERLRDLIVQANPERNDEYSLPPQATAGLDASSIDRQFDFLDQGLRDIGAEQVNMRKEFKNSSSEVEGRLSRINNQLYTILSKSLPEGNQDSLSPPPNANNGSAEQLEYMENSLYNLEQIPYSLNDQASELRSKPAADVDSDMAEKYETTLRGLWEIILAGEEEIRQKKRERRRLLAEDPDSNEELSPDEDNGNEEFSLAAFSSKVQLLFSRATSLKDKQSILMRQIKQQRELNNKSDAQKEAEFARLNEQVLSARAEKMSMENELERAMSQLEQFDKQKLMAESQSLRETQERNAGLEAQVINMQERFAAAEAELKEARGRAVAYDNQLKEVQQQFVAFQTKAQEAEQRSAAYEKELRDNQELTSASNIQARAHEERSSGYEAQIRDAQERALQFENKLREVQESHDDARIEAATIQAELTESVAKIDQLTTTLNAITAEKQAAEARSLEATNTLNEKEEEFRSLEGEIVRLTTELAFAKAELDGAYGSRSQRAAESAANPAIKKEIDDLHDKNQSLLYEIEALRKVQDAASQSEAEARKSERNLKAELSGMAAEYEALTRDAIQNEKDRDVLEGQIDKLRNDKEALERELSDEKVKWLGIRSPGMPQGSIDSGATSIRMLREDFRRMMRERTAEGLKALRVSFFFLLFPVIVMLFGCRNDQDANTSFSSQVEQEERRKLEALVRQLRKEANPRRSNVFKSSTTTTATATTAQ